MFLFFFLEVRPKKVLLAGVIVAIGLQDWSSGSKPIRYRYRGGQLLSQFCICSTRLLTKLLLKACLLSPHIGSSLKGELPTLPKSVHTATCPCSFRGKDGLVMFTWDIPRVREWDFCDQQRDGV